MGSPPRPESAEVLGESSITPATESPRKKLQVSFSPYARVLSVECRKDITSEEQNLIWWQDEDYDAFRKATSKLVKTMLNENINGWLGNKAEAPQIVLPTIPPPPLDDDSDMSSMSSPKRKVPQQYSSDVTDKDSMGPANQKNKHTKVTADEEKLWWSKYGDVACFHESRKRQSQVQKSIRSVLNEQARASGKAEDKASKIQAAYLEATVWARDWAIALAEACSEEVRSDFKCENCMAQPLASLFAMKVALSSMVDTDEVLPQNQRPNSTAAAITKICSSQIRYRQIVIRRPMKRKIGQGRKSSGSPTLVTSELVGIPKATAILNSKGAGYQTTHSPTTSMPTSLSI